MTVVAAGALELRPAPPQPATSDPSSNLSKPLKKKRKKRERGQRAKNRTVVNAGEEPRERKLRKGKVRDLDILRRNYDGDKMPRKTRELLERMAAVNGKKGVKVRGGKCTGAAVEPTCSGVRTSENEEAKLLSLDRGSDAAGKADDGKSNENFVTSDEEGGADGPEEGGESKKTAKSRKFDGMQPGESFAQFSARLRKESRQIILETAKKDNHQREKKRAYFAKKRERMERKKRRRRGDYSDDDVKEMNDNDNYEDNMSHLPAYWQEIVKNKGRPLSDKARRRQQKRENKQMDEVSFGERVERPPQFSSLPIRRGR